MKIGVVGAMREEVDLLHSDIVNSQSTIIGDRTYYTGRLYSRDVVLVFSRWGKVASASTVTTLINLFKVDFVVFTGVAGAASSLLNIGDFVISSELVQHDLDASILPSFRKFEVPLLGVSHFKPQQKDIDLAASSAIKYIETEMYSEIGPDVLNEFNIRNPKVVTGLIASGDQFIADSQIVQKLSNELINLQCVEMEGAAIAQVCYEHKIPFIVARAISDKADHSAIIDFPRFTEKVASYFSRGMIRNFLYNL